MPRDKNKPISRPNLILCEGEDAVQFIIQYLLYLMQKNEEAINSFQALDFGGNDELGVYLQEDLPVESGFDIVESI